MSIRKEDFQVYDKHLGNDGGAYKKLGEGTWYNDEMYQEALREAKNGDLSIVSNSVECPECMEKVKQEELDMFGGLCENCTTDC